MSSIGALNENPQNINLLEANKFQFQIPNLRFARYFCTGGTLPGVNTQEVPRPTPHHTQFHAGETLEYEPLVLSAQLDEDLRVWEETYNWLLAEAAPHKWKQYRSEVLVRENIYNDGTLEFNKNSHLSNVRIHFKNCHITSIGPVSLSFDATEPVNPICDITIRYDTFTVERIG